MKRVLTSICVIAAALILAWASVSDVHAQPRTGSRLNLLELLLGGALRNQPFFKRNPEKRTNTRRVIVNPENRTPGAAQPAPAPVVEKAEDAARVLVLGDFLAGGVSWGMEQAYSENPNVVFVDESSGSSGLVRDDVVDWPARTSDMIEETKPIAVIVAVGMNDRQQMRMPDGRLEKLSEGWKKEYEARIEKLIRAVRSRELPLIWMGLPAVRSSKMNADYLVFNDFYRTAVEAAGGQFVDIWDGFTDADGAFISAGPDINGQIVRLRNADGINMTRAGKRKLAFYAERELRKATGLGSDTVTAALPGLGGAALPQDPEYEPAKTGETIVISLDDPQVDGSDALAGEEDFLSRDEDGGSTAHRLVADGIALPSHEGRIDADWGLPAEPAEPETGTGAAPISALPPPAQAGPAAN